MRIPGTSRSRGRMVALLGVLLCAAGVLPAVAAVVTPPTCAGKTATIWGTDRVDTLEGTAGADVIAGLGGKDVIRGGGGNDTICGGPGGDRIFGGAGNNVMYGEPGNDIIKGGSGLDTINGGIGLDRLYGGDGSDTLIGGAGDDLIDGQGGANTANAGPGVDTCFNASDLTATCEPKWLGWDDGLAEVWFDSSFSASRSSSLRDYVDIGGRSYYQSISYGFAVSGRWDIRAGHRAIGWYNLGRAYRWLVMTVGLDDVSTATDVPVRIEVLENERVLATRLLNYGEHYNLKVDVTGVLDLFLVATLAGDDDVRGHFLGVVWGSPIVSANDGIAPYPPGLSSLGSISGTVTAEGSPVAGVGVEVLDSSCVAYLGSGHTEADGRFSVGDLATGSHKVVFHPDGLSPFVSEWWQDRQDCASADVVSVVAATDTPGINAVLGRDPDPPVVIVPDDITVQATGPDGAVVEYPKAGAFDSDSRIWEHLAFQFGDNRLVRNPGSYNEHLEFRKAVAYAIDKDALVEAIPGLALALDSYVEAYLPDWSQGSWAQYQYDPVMVAYWLGLLCAKPGIDCALNPPTVVFTTTEESAMRIALAEQLEPMLEGVGIQFVSQLEPGSLFFGETLGCGRFDVGEWAWEAGPGVSNLVGIHDLWDPLARPPYGQNYYRWGTPAVSGKDPVCYNQGPSSVIDANTARFAQIFHEMHLTGDETALRALVNEAESILADQLVFIPLFFRADPRVVSGPTCSPASGSMFPVGVTTVTCTASDPAGNVGSATFTVTVIPLVGGL